MTPITSMHQTAVSHRVIAARTHTGRARRGAVLAWAIGWLAILLVMAAVVLNWAYWVLVQRDLQRRVDVMALAGAPLLLDDDQLRDLPGAQADDREQAQRTAHAFRRYNNRLAATRLRLWPSEVDVATGYVPDVHTPESARYTGDVTVQLVGWDDENSRHSHNAVRVVARRDHRGANPVGQLIGGVVGLVPLVMDAQAEAALDSRLIGFRPEADLRAPVMPLAIQRTAWEQQRTEDTNGNGIRELLLVLQVGATAGPAPNAVLLNLGTTSSADDVTRQVALGLEPRDLASLGEQLGPATVTQVLPVPATTAVPPSTAAMLLLGSKELSLTRRVRALALYRTLGNGNQTALLDGFVAAQILSAEYHGGRLRIRLEPAYLIHTTAWTAAASDPSRPGENPYIHKLRLLR